MKIVWSQRPDNRLVADSLEADWNMQLRQLRQAERNYEKKRLKGHGVLSDQMQEKIRSLTDDFTKLWIVTIFENAVPPASVGYLPICPTQKTSKKTNRMVNFIFLMTLKYSSNSQVFYYHFKRLIFFKPFYIELKSSFFVLFSQFTKV